MRRCSRSSAGCKPVCSLVCGTGRETCLSSGMLVQPANSTTSAKPRHRLAVLGDPAIMICSIQNFDLLGRFGRNDRAAALLDPAAHPDAMAFELFGFYAGSGKCAAYALENDHGEIPRPAPPEVHIYSGSALAHRQHLAFHQRELTPQCL